MVGAGGRLAGRVAAQQPGRSGSKPWLEAALCYNAPAAEDLYLAQRPTAPQQRQPAEANLLIL